MKRFALVTLASFLLDTLWNFTVIEMSRVSWLAVPLSGVMCYMGAWVTVAYVKDGRLVHAAALGSMLGTLVTIVLLKA